MAEPPPQLWVPEQDELRTVTTDTPPPSPRHSAAAIKGKAAEDARMTVHGYGARAQDILAVAFANDVKVRQDPALMEILNQVEENSPIPLEALEIVTEILARVYAASRAEAQS